MFIQIDSYLFIVWSTGSNWSLTFPAQIAILEQKPIWFTSYELIYLHTYSNRFIFIHSTKHWLGLMTYFPCDDCPSGTAAECEFCRSRWYWLDGSTYDFQLWEWDDPNNNDLCAIVSTDSFEDRTCSDTNRYICKFPL